MGMSVPGAILAWSILPMVKRPVFFNAGRIRPGYNICMPKPPCCLPYFMVVSIFVNIMVVFVYIGKGGLPGGGKLVSNHYSIRVLNLFLWPLYRCSRLVQRIGMLL